MTVYTAEELARVLNGIAEEARDDHRILGKILPEDMRDRAAGLLHSLKEVQDCCGEILETMK